MAFSADEGGSSHKKRRISEQPSPTGRTVFTQPLKFADYPPKNWAGLWLHEFLRAVNPDFFNRYLQQGFLYEYSIPEPSFLGFQSIVDIGKKYPVSLLKFFEICSDNDTFYQNETAQLVFYQLFPEAQNNQEITETYTAMLYHFVVLAKSENLNINSRPFPSSSRYLLYFFEAIQLYQTCGELSSEDTLIEAEGKIKSVLQEIEGQTNNPSMNFFSPKRARPSICLFLKTVCHLLIAQIELTLAEEKEVFLAHYQIAIDHSTILLESKNLFFKSIAQFNLGVVYQLLSEYSKADKYYSAAQQTLGILVEQEFVNSLKTMDNYIEYTYLCWFKSDIPAHLALSKLSQQSSPLSDTKLEKIKESLNNALKTLLPVEATKAVPIKIQLESFNWRFAPQKKQALLNQLRMPRANMGESCMECYALAVLYLNKYKIDNEDSFLDEAKKHIQWAKKRQLSDPDFKAFKNYYEGITGNALELGEKKQNVQAPLLGQNKLSQKPWGN